MKCPGQDTRYWSPGDAFEISCGECGQSIEFFRDDGSRRCPRCGARVVNPKVSLGCAQWCEYARQCLGFDPKSVELEPAEHVSLADRLIEAMKSEFGDDQKRITHALAVLDQAQEILRREGGRPPVVIAAALLHDIGIKEAERRHGSADTRFQELEGPPIARRIMEGVGLEEATVQHVCRIVANHHRAADIDTQEFRIIWDADWLVNTSNRLTDVGAGELEATIARVLKTHAGRERVRRLYLKD